MSAPAEVWVVVDAQDRPCSVRRTKKDARTERALLDIYAHQSGPYAVVRYARVIEVPA